MKILTTYYSLTNNTKHVAQAINEQIGGDIKAFDEVENIDQYDFIAVGFFADRGFACKEAQPFLKKIKNKKIGFFITLGALPESEHAKILIKNTEDFFKENENEILAQFICQGKISQEVKDRMMMMAKKQGQNALMPITKERLELWKKADLHPNEEDFKNAKNAFKHIKEIHAN